MKKALIGILCALGIIAGAGLVLYFFFPAVIVKSAVAASRWSAGYSRHEVQVDDHRWVYLDGGKGDVILFLHGYGDSKDGWAGLPPAFMKDHRVVLPDLPGFGENSRVPADAYGIADQAKRLDRFAEAIGIKKFDLVGESMGGAIAAYYAGEHPEKVKSLMIMGPFGVRSDTPSVSWQEYQKDNSKILTYNTEEGFHRVMGWAFDHPPEFPGVFVAFFVSEAKINYDFNKKVWDDLGKGGLGILENRLAKISAPTLILWGKNDRIFHFSTGEKFKRGIRGSRLEILDCGHMVYFDEPAATIRLYKNFLKI
jgi:abhydrolase domain-containing protein 6